MCDHTYMLRKPRIRRDIGGQGILFRAVLKKALECFALFLMLLHFSYSLDIFGQHLYRTNAIYLYSHVSYSCRPTPCVCVVSVWCRSRRICYPSHHLLFETKTTWATCSSARLGNDGTSSSFTSGRFSCTLILGPAKIRPSTDWCIFRYVGE